MINGSCRLASGLLLMTTAVCCLAAEPGGEAGTRDALRQYFSGPDEPRVEKAAWTSDRIFNIGVHDMGASENELARHACRVFAQHGLAAGYRVRVIDINSMGNSERDWSLIGEARCQPDMR